MNKQITPRHDARKQAAVGRKLNAVRTIAPHVLAATVKYTTTKEVVRGRCNAGFRRGNARVYTGEIFYLVPSKFANRCYVVDARGNCSASDDRVACGCRAIVSLRNLQRDAA